MYNYSGYYTHYPHGYGVPTYGYATPAYSTGPSSAYGYYAVGALSLLVILLILIVVVGAGTLRKRY
ncbi:MULTISPECIES: hypothetical protein [Bacillaceae]|uniref:Sporulation protein YjcZ n=1 Tax=Evansella alkalicola TaxID=745819 RepID=A0ABS6JQX1_9BACI|nr:MULTISPECIES: hypothetical protein [Bacillaceae]MBU9720511.1 hypothetical protein [Bacillus alkalicola]